MITDELRKWAKEHLSRNSILAIADRIDAAYDEAITSVMNDALYYANDKDMAELGWIRLPVDANNEYIRVGDRMQVCDTGIVFDVTLLRLINSGWVVNPVNFVPSDLRHYHAPTVEDVLREFALACENAGNAGPEVERIATEYAAKLQLKESE